MSPSKQSIFKRGLRYLAAVIFGFSVDFVIFLALVKYGMPVVFANSIGFIFGFSINVYMIRLLAFPGTVVPGHLDYFVTFVVNLTVMVLSSLIIWTLLVHYSITIVSAKLLANGFSLLVNFVIRNYVERCWQCFLTYQKKR